jgi:hypothetical protein
MEEAQMMKDLSYRETKRPRDFGMWLIGALDETFTRAYTAHAHGLSEEAMLIQYDIVAASSTVRPRIIDLYRRTIRAACAAFDAGVTINQSRGLSGCMNDISLEACYTRAPRSIHNAGTVSL